MTHQNQLLAALSLAAYSRLAPHLQTVRLEQGEYVRRAYEPLTHCYFPISCLLSITLTMQNGATAEVGMVGN